MQSVCHIECAKLHAEKLRLKKEKKERTAERVAYRKEKEKQKTRGDFVKATEKSVNSYIRLRDAHLPCISCGCNFDSAQLQAGHYLAVSIRPSLRFNEFNINGQCARCNGYLKGNVANYRLGMLQRYGAKVVDMLESPQQPAHWSISDLEDIEALYKSRLKQLRRERGE
jgi:hypothetical protein